MRCTAFYRTHSGENLAPRPPWYSKALCLRSFIKAVSTIQRDTETDVVVLHDGPLNDNPRWAESLETLLAQIGTILELPKSNNSVSCLEAVQRACRLEADRVVIFSEDDYLWLPDSLYKMLTALRGVPAHYVTGYDHPVRYQPNYPRGADFPHWDTYIYFVGGHHWRTQESTCMTFATSVKVLRDDLEIFVEHHNNGKNYPDDRALFRHLQGLGAYDSPARRRLVGPMPSLNTHVHIPWLAPGVDWKAAAEAVDQTTR